MDELRGAVRRVAQSPYPVLVTGESGSGKELVARGIHRLSRRTERCFGAVNCAALTDELVEAELFGYARGAFTGAVAERAGLFEAADRGTLFLDEVGELSTRAQAKLLRVLQDGEIRRIGENQPRRVDVRVVAATNRPLEADVSTGRFREDLLYRVDVLRIVVPPLRDRDDDVLLLAEHFWRRAQSVTGSRASPRRARRWPRWPAITGRATSGIAPRERHRLAGRDYSLTGATFSGGPRRGVVGPSTLPACIVGDTGQVETLQHARVLRVSSVIAISKCFRAYPDRVPAGMSVEPWPAPAVGDGGHVLADPCGGMPRSPTSTTVWRAKRSRSFAIWAATVFGSPVLPAKTWRSRSTSDHRGRGCPGCDATGVGEVAEAARPR